MARKVFISFLGTSNYLQTRYEMGDYISSPTRFIQLALIDHLCCDWNENDKIFIFYTEKSFACNWLNGGQSREVENKEIENIGLKELLDERNLPASYIGIEVKEGFTESDIWDIFNVIYNQLEKEDQIYFDVTHAFRSIPMFSTVLFNYSRFMKNTEVIGIYYGAFEKLGPTYEAKQMPLQDRIAPIIDMTNIARLQQYTDMASSLSTFGRVKRISQILKDEKSEDIYFSQLSEAIEGFDDDIICNRMTEIHNANKIRQIKNSLKSLRRHKVSSPIYNVVDFLTKELNEFVEEPSNKNVEAAINWTIKYKMLPQAYTMGQEYIVSLLYDHFEGQNPFHSKKKQENKKKFRMFLSAVCSISDKDIESGSFKGDLEEHIDLTKTLLDTDIIRDIRAPYAMLGTLRNSVNHAKGDITYKELSNEFYKLYHTCLNVINNANKSI